MRALTLKSDHKHVSPFIWRGREEWTQIQQWPIKQRLSVRTFKSAAGTRRTKWKRAAANGHVLTATHRGEASRPSFVPVDGWDRKCLWSYVARRDRTSVIWLTAAPAIGWHDVFTVFGSNYWPPLPGWPTTSDGTDWALRSAHRHQINDLISFLVEILHSGINVTSRRDTQTEREQLETTETRDTSS